MYFLHLCKLKQTQFFVGNGPIGDDCTIDVINDWGNRMPVLRHNEELFYPTEKTITLHYDQAGWEISCHNGYRDINGLPSDEFLEIRYVHDQKEFHTCWPFFNPPRHSDLNSNLC